MSTLSNADGPLATEPDSPDLINITRFIVVVALFVGISLVSLRTWIGDLMEVPIAPTMTTQR